MSLRRLAFLVLALPAAGCLGSGGGGGGSDGDADTDVDSDVDADSDTGTGTGTATGTGTDVLPDPCPDPRVDGVTLNGSIPAACLPPTDFSVSAHTGETRGPDDLVGQPTVIWFYPAAGTPG